MRTCSQSLCGYFTAEDSAKGSKSEPVTVIQRGLTWTTSSAVLRHPWYHFTYRHTSIKSIQHPHPSTIGRSIERLKAFTPSFRYPSSPITSVKPSHMPCFKYTTGFVLLFSSRITTCESVLSRSWNGPLLTVQALPGFPISPHTPQGHILHHILA